MANLRILHEILSTLLASFLLVVYQLFFQLYVPPFLKKQLLFHILLDFTYTRVILFCQKTICIISYICKKTVENHTDFILFGNQFTVFSKNNLARSTDVLFGKIWLNSFPVFSDFVPPTNLS